MPVGGWGERQRGDNNAAVFLFRVTHLLFNCMYNKNKPLTLSYLVRLQLVTAAVTARIDDY